MHHSLLHSALSLSFLIHNSHSTPTPTPSDLDILAGQHIIYSFPSSIQPPQQLLDLTRSGLVGGVILFGENVDSVNASNTAAAMASLRAAYAASPAPALLKRHTGRNAHFLITTDQEGGKVRRMKNSEPRQSAKEIGASGDPAAAGKLAGEGAARTLREYNNNANLAPVLDVFRKAGDFTDFFGRSFGNTSQMVINAAIPFLKAQKANGIASTAKHFPGLGAAPREANTDLQPVILPLLSLSEIRTIDEAPYVAAIAAGIEMVMASWAIYPALDAHWPAGLSKKWIKNELRGRLCFKGVTITDAVEAGALSGFGNAGEIGELATAAGMDILLASGRDVGQGEMIRKALVEGLRSRRLSRREFDAATKRIANMRSRLWA